MEKTVAIDDGYIHAGKDHGRLGQSWVRDGVFLMLDYQIFPHR